MIAAGPPGRPVELAADDFSRCGPGRCQPYRPLFGKYYFRRQLQQMRIRDSLRKVSTMDGSSGSLPEAELTELRAATLSTRADGPASAVLTRTADCHGVSCLVQDVCGLVLDLDLNAVRNLAALAAEAKVSARDTFLPVSRTVSIAHHRQRRDFRRNDLDLRDTSREARKATILTTECNER
jgi:hypothetical protein